MSKQFTAGLAAELGFEPRQTESESVVLPLHNSAKQGAPRRKAKPLSEDSVIIISDFWVLSSILGKHSHKFFRRRLPPSAFLPFSLLLPPVSAKGAGMCQGRRAGSPPGGVEGAEYPNPGNARGGGGRRPGPPPGGMKGPEYPTGGPAREAFAPRAVFEKRRNYFRPFSYC